MTNLKILVGASLVLLISLASSSAPTRADDDAGDGYTYSLAAPDRRLDGQDYLSGPENWVGTVGPVEAALPDTRPITRMYERRIASDGATEEHWESCEDACGPGCGGQGKLMGGCKAVNDAQNPLMHSWDKPGGGKVTCGYETWQCKTANRCIEHDRCLLGCKIGKDGNELCKLGCHMKAAGFCATAGGWIWGDPIWGCWNQKLDYSRVIPGSCREG